MRNIRARSSQDLRTDTAPIIEVSGMRPSIKSMVEAHDRWRRFRCINLQPSENILSDAVLSILSSDMAGRYTLRSNEFINNSGAGNSYSGTKFMDMVEEEGAALAARMFSANFASLKPLSGHIASLLAVASTCRKGDLMMAVSPAHGGYDGYSQAYIPDILSLKFEELPFDEEKWNLDVDSAASMIERRKPRLVMLGQSFILFPYNIGELRKACDSAGSYLAYDASHVLGLIAGGRFQDPLREGADILIGSTHKSFPGPQGGIFATTSDDIEREYIRNTTWRFIDNAHWNRIAALSQALSEMKRYGRAYASRIQSNSRWLGEALHDAGIDCRFAGLGYSRSHQLHMDGGSLSERSHTFSSLSALLEENDVIIDTTGRLGTAEASRLGMGRKEMRMIASFFIEAMEGRKIRGKVNKLRRSFNLRYA